MKRTTALAVATLWFAQTATPQGRPVDWPSLGGDARRTGWERSDIRITKDNVKDFQLVLKRKFEGQPNGPYSLTSPIVIGLLISYKGFKELGFIAGASGDVWSVDVDVDRVFWKKSFGAPAKGNGLCATMSATPALTPPVVFGRRPAGAKPAAGSATSAALPARVGGTGFGAPRSVWVLAADGKVRQANSSDGSDQFPALEFLPAGAKASNLLMTDNAMYAATTGACGGAPNALWALDLTQENPKPVSFPLKGGDVAPMGGFAVGNDGTVYVQTGPGEFDPASNQWSNTLLALTPKDLKLKGYFNASAKTAPQKHVATPVVIEFQGKDLIVAATGDGRLSLLDSTALGGGDHKTALYQTAPLSTTGGIWGGLSTWEDADGARWVAAPVWGPLSADLKGFLTNGAAPNGSVIAFRVEEQNGKPMLAPAWVSRDLNSPVPPVVTGGIVFALSAGTYTRQGSDLRASGRAVLYAFDGGTGKEMYSTGNQVTSPASLTGLALANGRVFFTTTDNTLYGFGIYLER